MIRIDVVGAHETELQRQPAALHCEAVPASIVTRLGLGYSNHYYAMLAQSKSEIVLAAKDDYQPIGGLILGRDPRSLPRRLLLATPFVYFALKKPQILKGMFEWAAAPAKTAAGMSQLNRTDLYLINHLP